MQGEADLFWEPVDQFCDGDIAEAVFVDLAEDRCTIDVQVVSYFLKKVLSSGDDE